MKLKNSYIIGLLLLLGASAAQAGESQPGWFGKWFGGGAAPRAVAIQKSYVTQDTLDRAVRSLNSGTANVIARLDESIANLQNQVNNLNTKVTNLEATLESGPSSPSSSPPSPPSSSSSSRPFEELSPPPTQRPLSRDAQSLLSVFKNFGVGPGEEYISWGIAIDTNYTRSNRSYFQEIANYIEQKLNQSPQDQNIKNAINKKLEETK